MTGGRVGFDPPIITYSNLSEGSEVVLKEVMRCRVRATRL